MESKRQKQVAEVVKRNFGIVLQQEGGYVHDSKAFVTVTSVKMSPDLGIAKIYLSVYNVEDKQSVILEMEEHYPRLRQLLGQRVRKQLRRVPDIALFLDDTLDEMYRLNALFDRIETTDESSTDDEV